MNLHLHKKKSKTEILSEKSIDLWVFRHKKKDTSQKRQYDTARKMALHKIFPTDQARIMRITFPVLETGPNF